MDLRYKLAELIGTVFYIGKMPYAPGTWGSLAALIIWYLLKRSMIDPLFLLITGGLFFIGIAFVVIAEFNIQYVNFYSDIKYILLVLPILLFFIIYLLLMLNLKLRYK